MLLRDECYYVMIVIQEKLRAHYFYFFYQILTAFNKLRIMLIGYLRLYCNHCVDIYDGELLIPPGYHPPSSQCFGNLLFLNNVIFVFSSSGKPSSILAILFVPFGLLAPEDFLVILTFLSFTFDLLGLFLKCIVRTYL